MTPVLRRLLPAAALLMAALLVSLTACADRGDPADPTSWVEDEVSFPADGLTIAGTYRHRIGDTAAPAALLISESGPTDRNGDNAVVGPIGTMRQLAEALSERGVASLRYDKVGTGKTGMGPYATHPNDVVSAVYTTGAKAAIRYLADRPRTDRDHLSVYALGEGAVHGLILAGDTGAGAPVVHSLGLLQPLAGRYLDIITNRVKAANPTPETLAQWLAAVDEIRTRGTVPPNLPTGLGAVVSPGNLKAVVEADKIDPVVLAAAVRPNTPVLFTCSDTDSQADCANERPLIGALQRTALTVVELKGVNHVLHDDPTDAIANLSKPGPLSPQLTTALDAFIPK